MSSPVTCGAESTVIHVGIHRPIVGALICAIGAGYLAMSGEPDQFGGCGETGGDLYQVVEVLDEDKVCAVPEEAPVVFK